MCDGLIVLHTGSGSIYVATEPFGRRLESASNESDLTEPRRTRLRVLIVDDQKLIADTLVEILTNAGFDAVASYDGWQALEVASRFAPNWVISDVLMPRMNGVELAIAIRKNYPMATILLFSGQAGISEILQEGERKGFEFELIAKPIHPLRLIERINQG
jgi:CheY-like chemotaxis protein